MAVASAIPFSLLLLMRITGMMAAMLVLVWVVHFRGGMALISEDQDLIRNVHPVLTLIGLILLNGEAMLVYKTALGTKNYKKVLHLVLQAFALALGVTGIWAAYKFHNDKGIGGFYSLHSWLGLACIFLFGIQERVSCAGTFPRLADLGETSPHSTTTPASSAGMLLGGLLYGTCNYILIWLAGFASFWYTRTGRINKHTILSWHAFLGLYIYGLAVAAAETGFLERLTLLQASRTISRDSLEALVVNCLGLVLALLSGCVILSAITPRMSKDDVYRALQ